MIHRQREVVALRQDAFFDRAAPEHPHPQPRVAGGRIELGGPARFDHAVPVEIDAVAGGAVGEETAREPQLEVDVLLDFREARIVRGGVHHRVHRHRLFAGEVARRIERVNADVHQRAAARHVLPEPPLFRIADVEPGVRQDDPRRSELRVPRVGDERLVVRLVAHPVVDHQLAVRRLRRRDHPLAVRRRVGHRLLAEHVLAGLERADRVLRVHAVRQNNVDDVDGRVAGEALVVVVVVDVLRVDAVHLRELLRLLGPAADEPHELRPLASRKRRHQLIDREVPEPDQREPDLLPGRLRQLDVGHLRVGR
jgi:hypothetical protein